MGLRDDSADKARGLAMRGSTFDPSAHIQRQAWRYGCVIPKLERQNQEDLRESLTNQNSLIVELQTDRRPSFRRGGQHSWGGHLRLPSSLHAHTCYRHPPIYTNMNACTYIEISLYWNRFGCLILMVLLV